MTDTRRAQLSSTDRGDWALFVILPGPVDDWPEATWSTSTPPTVHQRGTALRAMGYWYADDRDQQSAWSWSEIQDPDDYGARVQLSAVAAVRPLES